MPFFSSLVEHVRSYFSGNERASQMEANITSGLDPAYSRHVRDIHNSTNNPYNFMSGIYEVQRDYNQMAATERAATTLTTSMIRDAASQAGLYHQPVVLGHEHGVTFSGSVIVNTQGIVSGYSDDEGSITIRFDDIDTTQYNLWRAHRMYDTSYMTTEEREYREIKERYAKLYNEEEDGNWV